MAVVQVSIERPNGNSNSSRSCNAKDCDRSCLTRCPTGSRGFAHTVLCGQRGRRGRHFPVNVRAGLGQIEYARTRLVRSAAGLDKKVNRSLRKPRDYVPAVSVSCSLTNYVTGTVLGRYRQPGDGLILRITCDPADRRGKSRCGYRHAQHGHQRDLPVCLHRMSLFTKLVQHLGRTARAHVLMHQHPGVRRDRGKFFSILAHSTDFASPPRHPRRFPPAVSRLRALQFLSTGPIFLDLKDRLGVLCPP